MKAVDPGEPIDRQLFATELVRIGAFRAPVSHPHFRDSGPIAAAVFVFPRTSVAIQHEGEPPFTADPCTVTYYNEGQRYIRKAVDSRGDICEWFAVRPDVLAEVLAATLGPVGDPPGRPFAFSHGPSDACSYALQRLVVRHVQQCREPDKLAVEEAILSVLCRIVRMARARHTTRSHGSPRALAPESPRVRAARCYLLENFTDSTTLDDVARAVDGSVFHLCRVFRGEVGTTMHQYRNQLRLRRSLDLVADHDSDLSRVAFTLGFSSHSHFSAAFRAAFDITPSEFRRRASSRRVREMAARLS